MVRFVLLMATVAVFGAAAPGETAGTEGADAPAAAYNPEEWRGSLSKAREQLNLIEMFAQATRFGGMTVKVPAELQKVPLHLIPGTEELTKRDIDLYVKEITFRDLKLTQEPEPLWMETRPLLPALLDFTTLGLSIEAKTRVGTVPLGATFRNGRLPFDLDLKPSGYDVGILPERRAADAKLDDLKLQVGGRLASGIANTFFKDDVANLVMKYGVGQTLKMGEGNLFSGGTAASTLLNLKSGSAGERAVSGLLDSVLR